MDMLPQPQNPASGHHLSYLRDVLQLREDETEEGLDERLRAEAKDLGVDIETLSWQGYQQVSDKPMPSSASHDGLRRSQESVGSRASQSTGFMSTFSDASRDHQHLAGRNMYRSSLSFRDYDAFVARGRAGGRQSISFSPPTTPSQSTFSLPLASPESPPKKHFRRIRGLSMLRLGRNGSNTSLVGTCPHCPRDSQSQRRAVHKLNCGHQLCTQALRNTIKTATDIQEGAVPSCCGIPIPGRLVEHVMTQSEQHALLERLDQWDDVGSKEPSVLSERRPSETAQHFGALDPRMWQEPMVDVVAPQLQQGANEVTESPGCRRLRQKEAEQRDCFSAWINHRKADLEAQRNVLRGQIKAYHEAALEELEDTHNAAMTEAEDKQVRAEGDMRERQLKEQQDNATALRHMEAYCAGTYNSGVPHNRDVTEQDRTELEKTRHVREQMDSRHDSAINVLRGEQSRRIRLRVQRQEREEQDLRRTQRKEELELERILSQENAQFDDFVAKKRHSMQDRRQLRTAVLLRKLERENGGSCEGRLDCEPSAVEHTVVAIAEGEPLEIAKVGISTSMAMRSASG